MNGNGEPPNPPPGLRDLFAKSFADAGEILCSPELLASLLRTGNELHFRVTKGLPPDAAVTMAAWKPEPPTLILFVTGKGIEKGEYVEIEVENIAGQKPPREEPFHHF